MAPVAHATGKGYIGPPGLNFKLQAGPILGGRSRMSRYSAPMDVISRPEGSAQPLPGVQTPGCLAQNLTRPEGPT